MTQWLARLRQLLGCEKGEVVLYHSSTTKTTQESILEGSGEVGGAQAWGLET